MNQTQEFPVVTGNRLAPIMRRNSIHALVEHANRYGKSANEFIWDALNIRYLRKLQVWKNRYARQRQHALQLQNTLTEKNAYIRELQDEIETLKTPDFFAK